MQIFKKGLPRKFAHLVLFCPIKKRSFILMCVLDFFFRTLAVNSVSAFKNLLIDLFFVKMSVKTKTGVSSSSAHDDWLVTVCHSHPSDSVVNCLQHSTVME